MQIRIEDDYIYYFEMDTNFNAPYYDGHYIDQDGDVQQVIFANYHED